tara:strand:+ start:6327 stop:6632 length:306 start_codon:yes stop_codon:yes gene_type:complete
MYLALFHGRDSKTEDMNDWGFSGPLIGPLRYFHTTYNSNVKLAFSQSAGPLAALERARLYSVEHGSEDVIIFRTDEGLMPFGDKFYGDWTVFCLVGGKVVM